MKRMRFFLIAAVLMGVALAGCGTSSPEEPGESSEEASPTDEAPAFEMVAPPGIYEMPGGDTQALGILTYRDLEGGFWAVVNTAVPEEAATAAVVAVIVPDDDIAPLMEPNRGKYVSVLGKREDGANLFMAGPVIEGKSIEVVSDMVVE